MANKFPLVIASGRTRALLYGIFATTIAGQSLTLNGCLKMNPGLTSVNGLTGTAEWDMPFQGIGHKKFLVYLTNFTSAGTVLTFPIAFVKTPYVYGDAAAIAIAATTTTTVTLTSVGAVAGFIFVEG